jgi:thiosulfate dehydrogenase [quinone] large subunit
LIIKIIINHAIIALIILILIRRRSRIIDFLRRDKRVSILLAVLRVYLGYTWFMAGLGKITGGSFDTSGFIQGALAKTTGEQPAVQE